MGALKATLAALALLTALPAHADPVDRWMPLISEAARRFGLPPAWIETVMRAESGGHPLLAGRPVTSRAGAMGLMQLMPATWASMRARLGLGMNPYDPQDNILAGAFYLRLMYDRFGYPGLFGAYNAGPERYAATLSGRSALPAETRTYLARVTGHRVRAATTMAAAPAVMPANALFVVRRGTDEAKSVPRALPALFAVRRTANDTGDHGDTVATTDIAYPDRPSRKR
ncbi:hypothetical protein GCM10023219_29130 [Stakelama sediminis]|uniref:Soluble lytic murein transglycosylase-like protein n=1 Tax=Stakelama sediminis TaxID=463200 RepID=A0A840Z388_9SPHN|nr:lytic transglycosylase domain-containing protein [Stakelama sediminis]MBB5720207.1 soluble lytic murein transglycosylase-like protein [Stakelama sediminis]